MFGGDTRCDEVDYERATRREAWISKGLSEVVCREVAPWLVGDNKAGVAEARHDCAQDH